MAQKRMFSKDIVGSDAFLDMPSSSQLLYFHLGMEADDDGFVASPKRIQKFIGCNDDDLKILLSKRFLLSFPSGVVVVKHHRINNNWDKYNCKRTVYEEEFSQLLVKENRAYTLDKTQGIPVQSAFSLEPVFRIEENRREEKRIKNTSSDDKSSRKVKTTNFNPVGAEVLKLFEGIDPINKTYYGNKTQRKACDFLLETYGMEKIKKVIEIILEFRGQEYFPSITNPYELQNKWVKIAEHLARLQKTNKQKNYVL